MFKENEYCISLFSYSSRGVGRPTVAGCKKLTLRPKNMASGVPSQNLSKILNKIWAKNESEKS